MSKRLTKGEPFDSQIFGVCSGISEYTGIDVTIIRIVWLIAMFYYGVGILPYFILAIVMPDKDYK
jgi:phage shock protein C